MNGEPLPGKKRTAFNLLLLSSHFVLALAALAAVAVILTQPMNELSAMGFVVYVVTMEARLILAWWLSFLAWWGVYFAALDEMPDEPFPATGWWTAMLVAEVLAVAASGLAVLWVFKLRQRQNAQAQIRQIAQYALPPAPLPHQA